MRILFITWRHVAHPSAGGSETYLHRVASGLHDRGHDVTLLAHGAGTTAYRTIDAGGPYWQYLRVPHEARAQVGPVDVIVDACNGLPFFTPLWSRTPSVLHLDRIHYGLWREWFSLPTAIVGASIETRALPLLYRRRLVTTVSQSSARALATLGVDDARLRVVEPGVDVPVVAGDRSLDPTFLVLGRLVRQKRHDLLLRAWERVGAEVGGTLLIAGDGPLRRELERQAPPGVQFLGHVSDEQKSELLARSWLLLQPSRLEGGALAVREAAAHGTPTLGLRAPGTRDAVVHGETGVLVRSERELVEEWTVLAGDEEARRVLGKRARARAEKQPWEAVAASFERVLEEAVDVGARRRPLPRTPRRTPPAPTIHPPASRAVDDVRLQLRLKHGRRRFPSARHAAAEHAARGLPRSVAGKRMLVLMAGSTPPELAGVLHDRGAAVVTVRCSTDGAGGDVVAEGDLLPFRTAAFDGVIAAAGDGDGEALSPDAVLHEVGRVLLRGGWAQVAWRTRGPGAPTVADLVRASTNASPLRHAATYPSWLPSQRWVAGVPVLRAVCASAWTLLLERVDAPDDAPLVRPTVTPRALARRSLRRVRRLIGNHPFFLPVVLRATPIGSSRAITRATDLVIEGFPRSGNTFAYFAVVAVERDAVVTSRVHTPSQVQLAVRRGIPTLLVVREPLDCLASNLLASSHVPIKSILEEYIRHHERLLPLLDAVVVATFEEVTTDFGVVVDALNERFGLGFRRFVHTPEATASVFAAIEAHHHATWGDFDELMPRPVPEHAGSKARLREELQRLEHSALVAQAQTIYETIASRSVTQGTRQAGGSASPAAMHDRR